jgi:hypothetical protein
MEFNDMPKNALRSRDSFIVKIEKLKQKLNDPQIGVHKKRNIKRQIDHLTFKLDTLPEPKYIFIFHHKDIVLASFERPIAHCVAEDLGMGAGAALAIRLAYGDNIRIVKGPARIGTCRKSEASDRVFHNIITKKESRDRLRFGDFVDAILDFRQKIIDDGILAISLTKLGSGLDMLNWDTQVLPLLSQVFLYDPVAFHAYNL